MTEAEFSHTLLNHWRKHGYFVQRIETGSITRGVPDLFVGTKAGVAWVELKSVKFDPYDMMVIPWRAGQQGWMLEYFLSTGKPCFTIVKFAHYIGVITMTQRFRDNRVPLYAIKLYKSVTEILL